MHKLGLATAIAMIGRSFIGGYKTRTLKSESKYTPHQGAQEIARRQRQAAKIAARKAGE